MTIREQLGLPKGVSLNAHPVYAAMQNGKTKKYTTMSYQEFIDKYLSTWEKGKQFNWTFMKWVNRNHGDMQIRTKTYRGYKFYLFVIPGDRNRKQISRVNKDELIELRNNYIIDNGLLGEFTLL